MKSSNPARHRVAAVELLPNVTFRRGSGIFAPTTALPVESHDLVTPARTPREAPRDACGIAEGARTTVIAAQHRLLPAKELRYLLRR